MTSEESYALLLHARSLPRFLLCVGFVSGLLFFYKPSLVVKILFLHFDLFWFLVVYFHVSIQELLSSLNIQAF